MKDLFSFIILMRPKQWIKNIFILVPLFFSEDFSTHKILLAFSAFLCFCIISSAVYVFNDIHDYEADKLHSKKSKRPLPAGEISLRSAWLLDIVLVLIGLTLLYSPVAVSYLPWMILYVFINAFYSLGGKNINLLEMFLVASGFLIRLAVGAAAVNVKISPWLMIATFSLSLMLVVGKRRADLFLNLDASLMRKSLSFYTVDFLDKLLSILISTSLVVYLMFVLSDYAQAKFGYLVVFSSLFVFLGLIRYLQIVMVKSDGDSPTDVIYQDLPLQVIIILFVCYFSILIVFK